MADVISSYNMFDIYKNVRREESEMGGGTEFVFSSTLVPILDEVIVTNNMKLLSKEQEAILATSRRTLYFKSCTFVSNFLIQFTLC